MLSKATLGVAAAASLALGALFAPVTASANYSHCDEQPEATGCPGYYTGEPGNLGANQHGAPKGAAQAHVRLGRTQPMYHKG